MYIITNTSKTTVIGYYDTYSEAEKDLEEVTASDPQEKYFIVSNPKYH